MSTERDFTRDDLDQLVAAVRDIGDYKNFVLRRFADYTHSGIEVLDINGRPVGPVDRTYFPRDNAGYGIWSVPKNADLTREGLDKDIVTVQHYQGDDRSPGRVDIQVQVPLSFILGEDERDAQYAEYLRLSATFEPQK